MTLAEISVGYRLSAAKISSRLSQLRKALKTAEDPEEIWHIKPIQY